MINKALNHIEELLVTFLMGAATLIIFVSVAHRYMAGVNIPGLQDWLLTLNFGWAQELCIIMFVWMAKFGAAYGVRTGIHVGVDVLINRLSDRMRGKFIVFGLLFNLEVTVTTFFSKSVVRRLGRLASAGRSSSMRLRLRALRCPTTSSTKRR